MVTGSNRNTHYDSSESTACISSTTADLEGQVSSLIVPQNMTYLGQILELHLGFCLNSQNKNCYFNISSTAKFKSPLVRFPPFPIK